MSNLGNWTTVDCPLKNEDKAFEFLKTKLNAIGATVRRKMNEHDFGPYPSFEIDIPTELLELEEFDNDEDATLNEEYSNLVNKKEKMIDAIDDIESEFSKMFHSDDE